MEYRHLGQSGLKVSEVCLGSWLTYGNATDDKVAEACIYRAFDRGINFFDTANVYAAGRAEEVVGRALKRFRRDDFVIATKVYFPMGKGPNDRGLSRKHIREQCDRSLKRLGVDTIDLYQCHRYDPETPLEETLRALDDLINAGKVLYVGFSEWTAEQIKRALAIQDELMLDAFISSQPCYNITARGIEKEVLPTCKDSGIGQIVFSPLAQGMLTGKYKPGSPPPTDSRAADPRQNMFIANRLDNSVLQRIEQLAPLALREGMKLSQLALAWCLRDNGISSVIIGASKPDQVDENAAAAGRKLSLETIAAIDRLFPVG